MNNERRQALLAYVAQSMSPPNNCPETMHINGGYDDGPTLGELRDLLTENTALEADNAALLQRFQRIREATHGSSCPGCAGVRIQAGFVLNTSRGSGASLLLSHAEELAAKDKEIARWEEAFLAFEQLAGQPLQKENRPLAITAWAARQQQRAVAAEADLTRTREALRKKVVHFVVWESQPDYQCDLCDGKWDDPKAESHNTVTINSVEWPCLARPKETT